MVMMVWGSNDIGMIMRQKIRWMDGQTDRQRHRRRSSQTSTRSQYYYSVLILNVMMPEDWVL
jgi:hypothetical protein